MSVDFEIKELPRLLFENNQSGLFVTEENGKLIDCNIAFVRMLGYDSKEEIMATSSIRFHLSEESRNNYLQELKQQGTLVNFPLPVKRKDGVSFYSSINVSIIPYDTSGTFILAGSIIDNSEEVESNKRLAESERKYRDLFENSMDIIQSFDALGRLNYCNQQWFNKLGYSEEDLKTISLFDLIDDSMLAHCSELFQEVMTGKALKEIHVIFKTKSGKKIELEGNVVPIVDMGKVIATHAFFRDVTDRNKMQRQIQEQNKVFKTLFETLPVALYLKSADNRYTLCNQTMEELMGSDITGKSDAELFAEDAQVLELLRAKDKLALESPGSVIKYDLKFSLDGESKSFYCGKKILDGFGNSEPLIFGFCMDISVQQKLIMDLEAKVKEIEMLMGEIHHRVKNNLAVIDGILEFKKLSTAGAQTADFLTDLQLRVKSIAIVHEKLYSSNSFSEINISDYIRDLTAFYASLTAKEENKRIEFNLNLEETFLPIAQSINFGLLLSELISNSVKYAITDSDLEITIGLLSHSGGFSFHYSDNGPGLKEKQKDFSSGNFGFKLIKNLIRQNKGEILNSAPKGGFELNVVFQKK